MMLLKTSPSKNSVEIYFCFIYSLTRNCDVFWTIKKIQNHHMQGKICVLIHPILVNEKT